MKQIRKRTAVKMPCISIIIPFYNVEEYIDECLKSVSAQTLSDIEVILINDASSDNSRSIAAKYAENDSRFKIIDLKERMGQGYARNRGMEAASGRYTGFADSDDFLEQDMFEKLYNAAVKDDTDITMCAAAQYDDMNKTYLSSDYYSLNILNRFGNSVFSADETKNEILDINVSLWNKIYKREFLIKTGAEFPEGFIYEDMPFFFETYPAAKRVNIVWRALYNYRVNRRNSTMMQFNNKILDRVPMVSMTLEKIKQLPYYEEIKKRTAGWVINDLFHRYTLIKEHYLREFFFLMKKVFENLEIDDINDDYWKRVYHFQGYLLAVNNSFESFNQKMFREYLDIHEVENRLRSEFSDKSDIERRISLIYDDIQKNYKYTEDLCAGIKQELQQSSSELQQNQSRQEEKIKLLYNEIKDLSYLIHTGHAEALADTAVQNEKISVLAEEMEIKEHELSSRIASLKNEINTAIDNRTEAASAALEKALSDLENKTAEEIKKLANAQAAEYSHKLSLLQKNFLSALLEQKNEYNRQLEEIKNRMTESIKELDETLRQDLKPFYLKLLDKR